MKKLEPEMPEAFIEDFTARAAVLADVYLALSKPEIATQVLAGLVKRDPVSHGAFLDTLDPDRWPLGRLDLCIRIPDYIRREIASPPRDVDVWVLRSPLKPDEEWRVFLIGWRNRRRGNDTSSRSGPVFRGRNGLLPMGIRTIIPDGPYQDELKAAGLLEPAFERVRDVFEVDWPTGGYVTLCLPK